MALQIVRTRDHRDSVVEFMEKSTKALSRLFLEMQGIDTSDLEINTEMSSDQAQMLHLSQMLDASVVSKIADTLLSHIWTFVINDTSQPLFTSDSPVTLVPNKFAPHRNYTGYAAEGIAIRMPLAPTCAIVLYERTHFAAMQPMEGKVIPLEEENVTYHNSVQINQSYRQIYSSNGDFELAELTCREHPEVCDPERSRWDIGSGLGN